MRARGLQAALPRRAPLPPATASPRSCIALAALALLLGEHRRERAGRPSRSTRMRLDVALRPRRARRCRGRGASARELSARRLRAALLQRGAARALFPEVTARAQTRELCGLLSAGARYELRERVLADPALLGDAALTLWLLADDEVDCAREGQRRRAIGRGRRSGSATQQLGWLDQLERAGPVDRAFNTQLLHHRRLAASRSSPASAARWSARFCTLLVTLAAVVPDRRRRGDLPRGVRPAQPLDRPDRGQHQQPRRRALDRLRPARAGGLHQLLRPAALGAAGRRPGADADDAADDHHRRRAAIQAVPPSIREAALGRRRLARCRWCSTTCCRWRCPAS